MIRNTFDLTARLCEIINRLFDPGLIIIWQLDDL